jgi:hypothetical protein
MKKLGTTHPENSNPTRGASSLLIPSRTVSSLFCLCVIGYLVVLFYLRNNAHIQIPALSYQYLVILPIFLFCSRALTGTLPKDQPLPRRLLFVALFSFVLLAGWIGWSGARGLLNPDESGYGFYARTLLSGRVMAVPLPGAHADVTQTPVAVFFTGHILRPYGWFTHFPPGWPLVLSLGYWFHTPGLVNPALSLLLLLITAAIGRHCYSVETGRLAVLIAVLSPFFLVNSVMRMSHMVCSVLTASACLLLFRGLRSQTLAPFAGAFALLGTSFFVRPYTGFMLTAVLGLSALWCVRRNRRLLAKVALVGIVFGALTIFGMMAYNRRYTGNLFVSPYAQIAGKNAPPELSLQPSRVWDGIRIYGRRAFQETLFSTFPFVFLLSGYTLLREEKSRTETIILTALYPILILAYVLHPGGSGIFYGERFHFEAYFAIAILGAQGLRLLAQRSGTPRSAWITILAALVVMQAAQLAIASNVLLHSGIAYRRMEESTRHLTPTIGLVFFHGSESFVAMHFNLNEPDWRKASLVYLVDPGSAERSEWACRVGRPDWIVLEYDSSTQRVREQVGHSACSAAPVGEVIAPSVLHHD